MKSSNLYNVVIGLCGIGLIVLLVSALLDRDRSTERLMITCMDPLGQQPAFYARSPGIKDVFVHKSGNVTVVNSKGDRVQIVNLPCVITREQMSEQQGDQ